MDPGPVPRLGLDDTRRGVDTSGMSLRPWPRQIAIFAFLGATFVGPALPAAPSCPPQGTGPTARSRALNRLKNRDAAPAAAQIDHAITLEAMVAPGQDKSRFSSGRGAIADGYVDTVYVGGIESANCEATSPAGRDTHIELSLDAQRSRPDQRVIVEVTPRWRRKVHAQGKDWSTAALAAALTRHRVRVTGWMMFDYDHAPESLNTGKPGKTIWRATAWEIHPVTVIEVLGASPMAGESSR